MPKYEEKTGETEVPKNVGIEGFLSVMRGILKLPRLQSLSVDPRGKVAYKYYLREGESPVPLSIDLDSIAPFGVVRNSHVIELPTPNANAAVAVAELFDAAARDHLFPVAFAAGTDTTFWSWYKKTTNFVPFSTEDLYGVPFLVDKGFESHVLILCAAFARGGSLIDTNRAYKIVIPPQESSK